MTLSPSFTSKLDPKNYPSFTLFWQCLGFILCSCHAMATCPCDVFVDTMGVGFGYPFVKMIGNVKIFSYTHYPIVSSDMIDVVASGTGQFNNSASIAKSPFKKSVKIIYYQILVWFYRFCGTFAD